MQQLTQKRSYGDMVIQEIPYPLVGIGMIIVKNHFSIISTGTEGLTVQAASKSLTGKAKERPQQFKQVLDTLRKHSPLQTCGVVMKKLDTYSVLGYNCSGTLNSITPSPTSYLKSNHNNLSTNKNIIISFIYRDRAN